MGLVRRDLLKYIPFGIGVLMGGSRADKRSRQIIELGEDALIDNVVYNEPITLIMHRHSSCMACEFRGGLRASFEPDTEFYDNLVYLPAGETEVSVFDKTRLLVNERCTVFVREDTDPTFLNCCRGGSTG